MAQRPNIVFINTDQQTWDTVSAYGNSDLKTPNIDRLHSNGVSFMRSYCTDPVCAPARASWVTGLYTSENGVCLNGGRMHTDIPDLGQVLNGNGYFAAHAGKWHVDGRNMRESFHNLYYGKRDIGASAAEYYDRVTTHAVIDFIGSYERAEPFFIQIGLVNPHDICEYQHNHEKKEVPGPERQSIDLAALPPLPGNFAFDGRETAVMNVFRRGPEPLIHGPILNGIRDWSEEQWRLMIWNHHRFTEAVDSHVGLILSALENSEFRDNTVIVFSVDHGEANGAHRMFQKFTLYEESIRVPLIISDLGGRFVERRGAFDMAHFVSGVDLLPTILDYADVEPPNFVQGQSIRPLVEGREPPWRDHAYIESNFWGRAIVTDRHKYIMDYLPNSDAEESGMVPPGPDTDSIGSEALFDLAKDPGETHNIADDPGAEDALTDCREKLFATERRLRRRPYWRDMPEAKEKLRAWHDRLNTED